MRTKLDQFPDFPEREAQPLHLPDETNSLDGVFCVQPESTRTATCLRQQVALLIETDRIDSQDRALGDFSDLHGRARGLVVCAHNRIIQSGAQSRVKRAGKTIAMVEQG